MEEINRIYTFLSGSTNKIALGQGPSPSFPDLVGLCRIGSCGWMVPSDCSLVAPSRRTESDKNHPEGGKVNSD